MPRPRRKRTGTALPPAADAPNRVWAVDIQFDATTDGRPGKIMSISDEHTRIATRPALAQGLRRIVQLPRPRRMPEHQQHLVLGPRASSSATGRTTTTTAGGTARLATRPQRLALPPAPTMNDSHAEWINSWGLAKGHLPLARRGMPHTGAASRPWGTPGRHLISCRPCSLRHTSPSVPMESSSSWDARFPRPRADYVHDPPHKLSLQQSTRRNAPHTPNEARRFSLLLRRGARLCPKRAGTWCVLPCRPVTATADGVLCRSPATNHDQQHESARRSP